MAADVLVACGGLATPPRPPRAASPTPGASR